MYLVSKQLLSKLMPIKRQLLSVSICNQTNCLLPFQTCLGDNQRFALNCKHISSSSSCRQNYLPLVCRQTNHFGINVCVSNSHRTLSSHIGSDGADSQTTSDDMPSDESSTKELRQSLKTKFKKYSDEDSRVIYDVDEELVQSVIDGKRKEDEEVFLYQQRLKPTLKPTDTDLKRGVTGVFDIEELVHLMKTENLKDIAVIEVPEELNYCQYLVLATATSKRQINGFMEYFNKVYKAKKYRKDPFIDIGGGQSEDWRVVDMKNIVMHVMLGQTRDYYDIETLWTVGHEFDDKTQKPDPDSVEDIMEKHIKFLQSIQPKS